MESINKNNAAENLGIEIAALKEKEALLQSIRNIQSEITTDQFAAREAFKGKFGQDMPTEDLGQAQGMLSAAEEEMAKGGPVDPALQNKVNLYRELIVLLEKEKQSKEEIDAKINDAQAVITERTNKKKEIEVKLDEKKKKLGDENNNVSRKALEIGAALNVVRDDGIKQTTKQQKEVEKLNKLVKQGNDDGDDEKKGLLARAGATFSYGLIIGQLRRVFQQTLQTVRELDKAMTEAAVVTSMNRKEAYELLGAYQQLARNTGLATSEISGVVVEFLKQGRTMKDAMELAEVSAKSAKVAGISAEEAVKYLTSAVNGFGLAATEAEAIADKFAAVAASSATDFNELAIAMSKVSPVAKASGVGVDFMMGVLAKGLETTREAPENIGTAFKTIFARMREVTDIGKATEDGMSLNRVEKALDSIGVRLRDSSGQFRNLETVLTDVGEKWTTLTTIDQAYIATSLAVTPQQPRLLAILNDFARTKE
jgi:TP901 family phage tail tape measure protein